jgi:hypothetical protein
MRNVNKKEISVTKKKLKKLGKDKAKAFECEGLFGQGNGFNHSSSNQTSIRFLSSSPLFSINNLQVSSSFLFTSFFPEIDMFIFWNESLFLFFG